MASIVSAAKRRDEKRNTCRSHHGVASDWATMRHAAQTLDALASAMRRGSFPAHRTPTGSLPSQNAENEGFEIVHRGAGGAPSARA